MRLNRAGRPISVLGVWRSDDERSARALRLLMVTPRYLPYMGGVENHVDQVARRLVRLGVDVTILTTDPGGRLPDAQSVEGIKVLRVPAWPANRDYYFAPDIYRTISSGGWDIVHVQSYHTLVPPLAMLASLRARIPYVVTFHGGGHSSHIRNSLRPLQRRLLRPLLVRAERLIALARFEVDLFGRELGIPEERFALIPNGSDLPPAPIASKKQPRDENEKLIVSVGRLERYKGHHRLIAALPHLLREEVGARVWIVGSGPYEEELRRLAVRLGVAERVEIRAIPPSDRQTMSAALSEAALFVLLSEQETHPIAALEAISLGCPALVADSPGLSELAAGGMARAVPLDASPRHLAAAVVAELRRPRASVPVDLPTWDECSTRLLALYRSVVPSALQELECAS